jgi:hypothetical protein
MAYEQAHIPVQQAEAFERLKSAVERIFASPVLEKFYGRLESRKVTAREFEKIVSLGLIEEADAELAAAGTSGKQLYDSLALSDKALMREFYLERIERVDPGIRLKYQRVYRYY